jgi:hypothetical protein
MIILALPWVGCRHAPDLQPFASATSTLRHTVTVTGVAGIGQVSALQDAT